MTFSADIPLSSDFIIISQPQLLNNFSSINAAFGNNHQPFSQQNPGFHNVLGMISQGSSDITTTSDEVGLYVKNGTGSQPQIFFRPASNGIPIQLSYQKTINAGPGTGAFQSFMAGPFVVLFGYKVSVSNGDVINYISSFPGVTLTTVTFCALQATSNNLIPVRPNYAFFGITASNVTTTSFTVVNPTRFQQTDPVPLDIWYTVIGIPA